MKSMKKTLLLLLMTALAFGAFAQKSLITPVDPAFLGRGYTAITDPGGHQSFFFNPAGFALENQFTALSINGWLFTDKNTIELLKNPEEKATEIQQNLDDPDVQQQIDDWLVETGETELANILSAEGYTLADIQAAGGPEAFFNSLTDEEIYDIVGVVMEQETFPIKPSDIGLPSGAARAGLSSGISFTRNGFGVGLFAVVDAKLEGQNILGAQGSAVGQLTFHAGYSHTLDLGLIKLHMGAQARPTLVVNTSINKDFIPNLMEGQGTAFDVLKTMDGIKGAGIGIDAGAIMELGWFKAGISATDLFGVHKDFFGTKMTYDDIILGELLEDGGALLPQGENSTIYPVALNFGVGFNPSIPGLNKVIDPYLYVDFQDINGVITAAKNTNENALLDLVKVGADVKILNFLNARAGYADGYFTLGAGVDLLFLEANVAATFGTLQVEDISDFGVTAEFALRF